jgi:hypothetical protein
MFFQLRVYGKQSNQTQDMFVSAKPEEIKLFLKKKGYSKTGDNKFENDRTLITVIDINKTSIPLQSIRIL